MVCFAHFGVRAESSSESLSLPRSELDLSDFTSENNLFDNQASSLGWGFNSYVSSGQGYFREGAKSEISDLDLRVSGYLKPLNLQMDIKNTYRTGEDHNYFKPYELYVPFSAGQTQIQVGRVLKNWSWSDAYWQQGLWQPRFMDDKILTEAAGLTGVFVENNWDVLRSRVWLSPVNIPELGPSLSVEEGRFVSANPWFNTPPEFVDISGVVTRVEYSLKQPKIEDFVLRPGAGFSLESDSPWFERLSYAYKPVPQIMLGFPYYLALGEVPDSSALNIEVNTRLLYHHIATWETKHESSQGTFLTSLSFEAPERDVTPTNWISQEVKNATVASAQFQRPVDGGSLLLGWLKVWGGDQPDSGEFAPAGTVFERRYQYLHALRMGWNSSKIQWGSSLIGLGSDLIYDFDQAGVTWRNQTQLQASANIFMHLRADLIGLTGGKERAKDSFIRSYRANDRIQAGVRYVF